MKNKILYWLPRVLAIAAILFMMVFSLDCFENQGFKDVLTCFIMHNIPAFIIIIVLVIAWKWEFIGGILFLAVFLGGSIYFRGFSTNPAVFVVMTPFLVTGVLFIWHYVAQKPISEH